MDGGHGADHHLAGYGLFVGGDPGWAWRGHASLVPGAVPRVISLGELTVRVVLDRAIPQPVIDEEVPRQPLLNSLPLPGEGPEGGPPLETPLERLAARKALDGSASRCDPELLDRAGGKLHKLLGLLLVLVDGYAARRLEGGQRQGEHQGAPEDGDEHGQQEREGQPGYAHTKVASRQAIPLPAERGYG